MLMDLMKQIRDSGGYSDIDELSKKMGVDRNTLEGMIDTLKRQGKLLQLSTSDHACGSCNGCSGGKSCH